MMMALNDLGPHVTMTVVALWPQVTLCQSRLWADRWVSVVDRYRFFRQWSGAAQRFPAWARDPEGEAVLPLWHSAWAGSVVWRGAGVGSESRRSVYFTNSLCSGWTGLCFWILSTASTCSSLITFVFMPIVTGSILHTCAQHVVSTIIVWCPVLII